MHAYSNTLKPQAPFARIQSSGDQPTYFDSPGRHKAGFTLIELLVVIAIIAILAAMLLPALSLAKTKAQALHCMSDFKQLQTACIMYTGDFNEFFPPNPDDANKLPGYCWCGGDVEGWYPGAPFNSPDAYNQTLLQTCMLAPYIGNNIGIFKCPADNRIAVIAGKGFPVVRSCSSNQGVGTTDTSWLHGGAHSGPPTVRVSGPWLTGTHTEFPYSKYASFGKTTDFRTCSPSDIWVYDDEDPHSINDVGLAAVAAMPRIIDYPTTRHRNACGFSFADGHAEIHKWRSNVFVLQGAAFAQTITGGPTTAQYQDWFWLAWHASRSSVSGTVP